MPLIELLRRFTIRTRMLGAIAMVMVLLVSVGGAGLLGMTHVAGLGETFIDASARAAATQQAYLMFGAVVLTAIVLVVPLTLANMVSICRPMDDARALAGRIAAGDLSSQIATTGADESAHLLRSLAAMQESLKTLVGQVRDASQNIQLASAEVASGNGDLSARTEQAASNLQQTAASLYQLTGTVKHSAASAATANQLAGSAAQVAQRGGAV